MRTENWDSIIRAGIATIVVTITWKLTWGNYDIAAQWEAVFLMVIAYYFKDRPQADKQGNNVFESEVAARIVAVELIAQFVIAMLLLVATAVLFATPRGDALRDTIAGAWVGGVTLAIAFYFKDVEKNTTTTLHSHFRSALAIATGGATLAILILRLNFQPPTKVPLPLQWIALAFIVITFYFKEKGDVQPSATSKARAAARMAAAAET